MVPTAKFQNKCEAALEIGEGWCKPTGGIQKNLELDQETQFVCSWDEEKFIAKGSFVNVIDLGDINETAKKEFCKT